MKKYFIFFAIFLINIVPIFENDLKAFESKTIIILMGPPASGKGTQAVELSRKFNFPHISTGEILRENIKKHTDLGRQVEKFVTEGKYVSDDLIFQVFLDRVSNPDCQGGYILDGFPGTLFQAKALDNYIGNCAHIIIFNLNIDESFLLERINGRLVCKKCGTSFHKIFLPPKSEFICDYCNGELYHRDDDKAEILSNRLSNYHLQRGPLIQYYKNNHCFFDVIASRTKNEILEDLIKIIQEN